MSSEVYFIRPTADVAKSGNNGSYIFCRKFI